MLINASDDEDRYGDTENKISQGEINYFGENNHPKSTLNEPNTHSDYWAKWSLFLKKIDDIREGTHTDRYLDI